jgi:hypothetical protein
MRILFLQPELMHAYIRAQWHKEVPEVYVNKQAMVYVYKELGTTYKYSVDPSEDNFDFVMYQDDTNESYDKELLAKLVEVGIKPFKLSQSTMDEYKYGNVPTGCNSNSN